MFMKNSTPWEKFEFFDLDFFASTSKIVIVAGGLGTRLSGGLGTRLSFYEV